MGTPALEIELEDTASCLRVELLRDGRVALGTRSRNGEGGWDAGALLLLDRRAYLALAAWLADAVEAAWTDTVRRHQPLQLQTARDLYGESAAALERLADDLQREISPALRRRALLQLANAIGPEMRERLVERLNSVPSTPDDAELRRRLNEERDAFAYVLAAAALYDALARGPGEEAGAEDRG